MIRRSGSLRAPGIGFPMEIWAHVRASLAAALAGEPGLDVGQPNIIWPSVAADCCRMAALIIRAIDQEATDARGAHLSEGDLLGTVHGHYITAGCGLGSPERKGAEQTGLKLA
jgi:hypothetical protein